MIDLNPFRNLQTAMIATLHVAVVATVVRSFIGPGGLAGSVAVWAPLSIALALFVSMPLGHAVAAAFRPGDGLSEHPCPRCARGELRPLLRAGAGAGLFPPIVGYRCAGCGTTYRPAGDSVIEEPPPAGPASASDPEIRFLDDANIAAGPVSDA